MTARIIHLAHNPTYTNRGTQNVFIARWKATEDKIVYSYHMEKKYSIQIASQTVEGKVHYATQLEHKHICSCEDCTYRSEGWAKDAIETETPAHVCKHMQALIDAGVFQEPPTGRKVQIGSTKIYEATNMGDLEIIGGRLCVPLSVTGNQIVEVTLLLPRSTYVFKSFA